MKARFYKLPGIEAGEEPVIYMLLAQSVFFGIFFGAFDIGAHSLFLSVFDEKMMARGYVVSGLIGIVLTLIYAHLQNRMLFRHLATVNLVFVTAVTFILWLLLLLKPSDRTVFLIFIMLGPLNILAMLGFRGTVSRLVTMRHEKRLFGLTEAGILTGIILGCYAIPVLLAVNFRPHNILLISAAAVLAGSIIQIMAGTRSLHAPAHGETEPAESPAKRSVLILFREDPNIRIMGMFIALSVMTAFFVQYSFMAVTREQYPAEADMARFLGIFTGSMMIFALFIRLFGFEYIIRNFGLRTCLAISPVLIAVFTVIAIGTGMAIGYTPAAGGFMLFFILLALSRLFSRSLKESIESPSFKIICQTIDERIRSEVRSGMDGTMNEIAALSSGLILTGLGMLSFIKLIHFSLVLFFVAILWLAVAIRLYSVFRKSVRKTLETGGQKSFEKKEHDENTIFQNRVSSKMAFQNEYFSLITDDQKNLARYRSSHFFDIMLDHAESRKDINLIRVLKNLSLYAGATRERSQRATDLAESLELLLESPQPKEDRILSAQKILAGSRQPQTTQILRLLRDSSPESKKLAICMIGKFRMTDMIPEICECLNVPGLEIQAESVLRSFGEDADEDLRRYYIVSAGNIMVRRTILRILGENCRTENQAFLFSRLWSGSRQIKETALNCLTDCEYKSSEEERARLNRLISDIIGVIVWNLSAEVCLRRENDIFLPGILNKETARWNEFLFNILSIAYDSRSISTIRANLESGTAESVRYAIEMADMAIDESIKPKLIPLLDVISDEEKLKNLYQFYPGEIPDYQKLMENIINRDYNLLGIWTRACTIRNIPEVEGESLVDSLVALLFSPESILQEESAMLLVRSGREIFRSASSRIPAQVKSRLDMIVGGTIPCEELLYEKVKFLSECFKNTKEDYLLVLAESLKYMNGFQESLLPSAGGFILWSVAAGADKHDVEIIYEDQKAGTGKSQGKDYIHYYFLPLKSVEEFCYRFPEESNSILSYIEINERN